MYVGAISGYTDGRFLPERLVSRGEFSKMLYYAFGWYNSAGPTPSTPTFKDVPTTHDFYRHIEEAARRGIVNGFNTTAICGSTSNIPCFKPDDNVRRGEMAKMLVRSQGWPDNQAAGIPYKYGDSSNPNNFFPAFIETLAYHAVRAPAIANCSAPPCFSYNAYSPRRDAATLLAATRSGRDRAFTFGVSPQFAYAGVQAKMRMITSNDSRYAQMMAGVVGATDAYNSNFIESGPAKVCFASCSLHPFGTSSDGINEDIENVEYRIGLSPDETRLYRSVYSGGSGVWRSYVCDIQNISCTLLAQSNDLGGMLPYVSMAAESTAFDLSYGTITGSEARLQYGTGGAWYAWCYDPFAPPWRTGKTIRTDCVDSGWSLIYVRSTSTPLDGPC